MLARPVMELRMGLVMVDCTHTVLLIDKKVRAGEGPCGVEDQTLSIAHGASRKVDLCDCRCVEAGRGILAQHLHTIMSYAAPAAWGERAFPLAYGKSRQDCCSCCALQHCYADSWDLLVSRYLTPYMSHRRLICAFRHAAAAVVVGGCTLCMPARLMM